MPSTFTDLLSLYRQPIEDKLKQSLSHFGQNSVLKEACEYALLNGGKRFRPALVIMIAKSLGREFDASSAALAVEYFHTASLVADDLPCMDNDDMRRDKPSVHKVYGEATALLVSYALISAGYGCLSENSLSLSTKYPHFAHQSAEICVLALENATYNTGILGATGGQFLDIYPPELSLEVLREVVQKKTVSLFELAFVLGWLYGGGATDKLPIVKQAAAHFGMAFQIADDFDDLNQDAKNGRLVNFAAVLGMEKALALFHEELSGYESSLKLLEIKTAELKQLGEILRYKVQPFA